MISRKTTKNQDTAGLTVDHFGNLPLIQAGGKEGERQVYPRRSWRRKDGPGGNKQFPADFNFASPPPA